MKITKRQLLNIIRESFVNEIGGAPGMDPTGATMPKGMKRSEYDQLADAYADPQNIIAALSVLPPLFIPSMVLSAILYFLDGETETAASTLALTVIFGGGAQVLNKLVPVLKAGLKAGGAKTGDIAGLVKAAESHAQKAVITPPKPHHNLPKKQASDYTNVLKGNTQEPFVMIAGNERIYAREVFKSFSKNGAQDIVFVIAPTSRGGHVYRITPKRFYDKLGTDASVGEILKELVPSGMKGDIFKIYDGIPGTAGGHRRLKLTSDLTKY